MYSQIVQKSAGQTLAPVGQKPTVAARQSISARAHVEELIRTTTAQAMQDQLAVDPTNLVEMISASFDIKSADAAFKVNHREQFTVRREIGFSSTLNGLAENPSLQKWNAADAAIKLPAGSRAILMSATIKQTQNSAPVAYDVVISNLETNSKWTAGLNVNSDLHLKPHMSQPMNCEWGLYQRQNVESFDVSSLAGWENITEEGIRSCIIKENPDTNLSEVLHPSIVTQLILLKLPEISQEHFALAHYGVDATTGEPITIAHVRTDIANKATELGVHLNNQVAFSDPNKIQVQFIRADGKAINSIEGLIDATPDTAAFQRDNVANQIYHTGVTLELVYTLWNANASS